MKPIKKVIIKDEKYEDDYSDWHTIRVFVLLILKDHLPKSWSIDQDFMIQGVRGSSENNQKTKTYGKIPDFWNRLFI